MNSRRWRIFRNDNSFMQETPSSLSSTFQKLTVFKWFSIFIKQKRTINYIELNYKLSNDTIQKHKFMKVLLQFDYSLLKFCPNWFENGQDWQRRFGPHRRRIHDFQKQLARKGCDQSQVQIAKIHWYCWFGNAGPCISVWDESTIHFILQSATVFDYIHEFDCAGFDWI